MFNFNINVNTNPTETYLRRIWNLLFLNPVLEIQWHLKVQRRLHLSVLQYGIPCKMVPLPGSSVSQRFVNDQSSQTPYTKEEMY